MTSVAVVLALSLCVAAGANVMYARGVTVIYSATGPSIGSIMPGSRVSLRAASQPRGPRTAITIDGWSIQGADSVIYTAVGQRIILATLSASAIAQRKVLAHERDSYGTVWNHVDLSAAVGNAQLTPDVSTVWTAAHNIYAARCSACHALHAPTEFTANQWPGILSTMAKNAALDPGQAALVRQYLQTHARKP